MYFRDNQRKKILINSSFMNIFLKMKESPPTVRGLRVCTVVCFILDISFSIITRNKKQVLIFTNYLNKLSLNNKNCIAFVLLI